MAIADAFSAMAPTVVVSAAVGGIVLGYEVARQLGTKAIFVEKEAGTALLRRSFALGPNDRALVVEDVVTTGLSVKEVIGVVRAHGAQVAGVAIIVMRGRGRLRRADARLARSADRFVRSVRMSAVYRGRADRRSGFAPVVNLAVRPGTPADRAYVTDLGKRTVVDSVAAFRPAPEKQLFHALDRLYESIAVSIAPDAHRRIRRRARRLRAVSRRSARRSHRAAARLHRVHGRRAAPARARHRLGAARGGRRGGPASGACPTCR